MSDANNTSAGWIIFIAALGMMLGMMAIDIAQYMKWADALEPSNVGTLLGHLSSVIAAFVGGKLIPESRDKTTLSRSTDQKQGEEKP